MLKLQERTVFKDAIKRAEQILVDNGIEVSEAGTVLQALGYALLDTELYPEERPMTTTELFNAICSDLKEEGKLPEILDYWLASGTPVQIKDSEFCLRSNLDYGSSEGIYLDLCLELHNGADENKFVPFGTFKTLETDDKAMRTMALLLADFILGHYKYIDGNYEAFTWSGISVFGFKRDKRKPVRIYRFKTYDEVFNAKEQLLSEYCKIIVLDHATKEERVIE